MSLELRFFNSCDHVTKSEPLILDENGVAETRAPVLNSKLRLTEENIRVLREPIVRSATEDFDALIGPLVTNIDLVVHENLHLGILEKRKYIQGRDYTLSGRNFILWSDTAIIKPNPGDLYFVDYRIAQKINRFTVVDGTHIKVNSFDPTRSYVGDYLTSPEFCTKCNGPGKIQDGVQYPSVTQDIVYGVSGDFGSIQGTEKLKQDMIRAILAIRGSNPREPYYGTSIESSIGTAQPNTIFQSLISQEIRNSLNLLQRLQQIQAGIQNKVDPSEILKSIVSISLNTDRSRQKPITNNLDNAFDPTEYYVSVVVQSGANNLVDFFVPMDVFSQDAHPADTPTIEIFSVNITNITQGSAIITWITNIDTDSIIDYGTTQFLSNREIGDSGRKHLIMLNDLESDTLYYFKIATRNRGFVFGADLRTFNTLP